MEALLERPVEDGQPVPSSVSRSWYLIWWALCAAAAVGGVFPGFGGRPVLLVSMGLFSAAAAELFQARNRSRGESIFALLVLFCFASAQTVQREWLRGPTAGARGFDFSAYYLAARELPASLPGGLYQLPLYPDGRVNLNVNAPTGSSWAMEAKRRGVPCAAPFIYPPLLAVMLRPLGALSFWHAYRVWCVAMLGCTLLGVVLAWRAGRPPPHRHLVPLAGVALFSYYPMLEVLLLGQSDSLILLLLAACFWLLARGRSGFSALCFAAAALIKLTPLLALPIFAIHRKWKWLCACAAWSAVLSGFSIFEAGWEAHRQFLQEVLPHLGCGVPLVSNTSLVAYVQEWSLGKAYLWQHPPATLPPGACATSRYAALAVYAAVLVLLYAKRKNGDCFRDFSIAILLGLVVSPISWWHHYTVALLPFLYLWRVQGPGARRLLLVLFAALATNLPGFGLIFASNPVLQLTLAGMVPGLLLAVIAATLLRPGINACVPGGARLR